MEQLDPTKVVEAVAKMKTSVDQAGENTYITALLVILRRLFAHQSPWDRQFYEEIRDEEASRLTRLAGNDLKKLDQQFLSRLEILHEDDDGKIRLSCKEDLRNPAKRTGKELINLLHSELAFKRCVAHNYCLAYPERMWILTQFGRFGANQSDVKSRILDKFVIHKKINSFIISAAIDECRELGMLTGTEGLFVSKHVPPPVYAMVITSAFLDESQGDLIHALKTRDIEYGFVDVFGKPDSNESRGVLGPWRYQLGHPGLLQDEVNNTKVRLTPTAFYHLLSCGILDPRYAAMVLRHAGATQELKQLEQMILERAKPRNGTPAVNLHEYMAKFQPGDSRA